MSTTTSQELLDAIAVFLRQEVLPELNDFKAYNTRIAANALAIVAREMEHDAQRLALDRDMANALGFSEENGPVGQQIARALRDGSLHSDARLLDYLKQRTVLSIAIDNPKYAGLRQARALWET